MPTGTIKHHNHPMIGISSGYFIKKYLHTIPVDVR